MPAFNLRATEMTDRNELIQSYIDRVVDNMSTKDLVRIVWEQLEENLANYTDEELISEVEEYYPELLEV
jgi:transcriptional regulator CtsR